MRYLYFLCIVCVLNSCAPKPIWYKKKCTKYLKNDFGAITDQTVKFIIDGDSILATEVKFECVYSAFYTQKVMYNHFGKWDKALTPDSNENDIALVWYEIPLDINKDQLYTIIANGQESSQKMYASIVVLDEHGRDVLYSQSSNRDSIIDLFSKWIREDNSVETISKTEIDFYEAYWGTFFPDRWKQIKAYRDSKNKN